MWQSLNVIFHLFRIKVKIEWIVYIKKAVKIKVKIKNEEEVKQFSDYKHELIKNKSKWVCLELKIKQWKCQNCIK